MATFKKNEYWHEFKIYQSFKSAEQMFDDVKLIQKTFSLSDAAKRFLNTLKLHSKNIFGVSFLKIAEICKKAKMSPPTAHRAKNDLIDAGIITVHNQTHTKKGGKAANVYVIHPFSSILADSLNDTSNESLDDSLNDSSESPSEIPSIPCGTSVSELSFDPYSNSDSDLYSSSKKNLQTLEKNVKNNDVPTHYSQGIKGEIKDATSNTSAETAMSVSSDNGVASNPSSDIKNVAETATGSEGSNTGSHDISLKRIPNEFLSIFNPFYANNIKVIRARWLSTCIAAKKTCNGIANLSFDLVRKAWKVTVNSYKTNKIHDSSEDGLGAYYYSTLKKMISDSAKEAVEAVEPVEQPEEAFKAVESTEVPNEAVAIFNDVITPQIASKSRGLSKNAKPIIPIVQYEDEAPAVSDEELAEMIRFAEAMQANSSQAADMHLR